MNPWCCLLTLQYEEQTDIRTRTERAAGVWL